MKRVIGILLFIFIFMILLNYQNNRIILTNNNLNTPEITLGDTSPSLITPYYSTNHFIVADYVISPSNSDMTDTIQNALNSCYSSGGGTVWLERGIYMVSKPITIPNGCTLMGDWQDPDNYSGTLDYGTKIVVDIYNFKPDSGNGEQTGLFRVKSASGIEGITIFYKNQNITNPSIQPWTIYYTTYFDDIAEPGKAPGTLFTIKNVTMINSYRGIGRSLDEKISANMLNIENVKGTILKKGLVIHDSGEVGTINGLTLSPKYWSKANLKAFNINTTNPSESSIISKIKEMDGIGLTLTDVEQSQYTNVFIMGYKYGIYIPNNSIIKTRAMGSGEFYNLNITNCNIGIMVEDGYYKDCGIKNCTMLDHRLGYAISNSTIEGSQFAIYTQNPVINGSQGTIKLNDVSIKGKVSGQGAVIYSNNGNYISVTKDIDLTGKINNSHKFSNINLNRKLKNNGNNFTYLNKGSNVDTINKTLSDISKRGGGVVYLKSGIYIIDKTIIIPSNVELRGTSSSLSHRFGIRNGNGDGIPFGTVLSVKTNVNAIKLNGDNSGVYGINIIYESNVKSVKNTSNYSSYTYTIIANNVKNIYLNNISILGATHGINLSNTKEYTIKNIVSSIFNNVIKLDNSSNGIVLNTLQNGAFLTYNLLYYGNGSTTNRITGNTFDNVIINNSNNVELCNIFSFNINRSLVLTNSSVYAINIGKDGSSGDVLVDNNNSTGVLINSLVFSPVLRNKGNNIFGTYNIIRVANKNERDNVSTIPKPSQELKGDVNQDGKVNAKDYILIRKHILNTGLTGNSLLMADVNQDGKINAKDYIAIRKIIIGL